jgi:hypothetical protein
MGGGDVESQKAAIRGEGVAAGNSHDIPSLSNKNFDQQNECDAEGKPHQQAVEPLLVQWADWCEQSEAGWSAE